MSEKCFCHFNGYEVKDAKARNDIGTINENIGTINENIETINDDVSSINNQINSGRKYIFIGDSYGTGNSEVDGTRKSWTQYVPEYLGLSTSDYYTKSVDGAGFKHGSTFIGILQSLNETITDKSSITDIIVCGGYNDAGHNRTDIETAISEFIDYVKENYPNALVSIGCIGWSKNYSKAWNVTKSIDVYKECVKYGARYLNNVEFANHFYNNFVSDGYHPNDDGQIRISTAIAQAIQTGSASVSRNLVILDTLTCVLDGGNSFDSTQPKLYSSINNELCTLFSNGTIFFSFTSTTLNKNEDIKLAKLGNNRCVNGSDLPGLSSICTKVLIASGGVNTYHDAILSLKHENGETYLTIRIVGQTNETVTNTTAILLLPFSMQINSIYC